MANDFFEKPILNSPYGYPERHWELDEQGQPTQQIVDRRRPVRFITPIPKPKKRKASAAQQEMVLGDREGISTTQQQYDLTSIIDELRRHVDEWRKLPNSRDWTVTPETARLLQHWGHHKFSDIRPFFCQVEAVETAIWLTEVAPKSARGKRFLDHLANANNDANPGLSRLALKLATGAGKTTVMAMIIAWRLSTRCAIRAARISRADFWSSRQVLRSKIDRGYFSRTIPTPTTKVGSSCRTICCQTSGTPRSSSPTITRSSFASGSSFQRAGASSCRGAVRS